MALPETEHDASMLALSCDKWADYPTNLVYPSEFEHELASYRGILNNPEVKLFLPNPKTRWLRVLSLETASQDHILTPNLETKADVQQILDLGTSCPIERYIFVQSASSRGPLACEKEQMLLILSHIQVMPSFLDIMFTFRARENPHTRTRFSYETCLGKSQPRMTLPSLSISGFRIQHCFNLIGIEKDVKQQNTWLTRQTAAYYSFDVAYHRSTWIVLKGNKLIRDRLENSTAGYRKTHPEYPHTAQGCFLSSLRSHMLIFQWSAETWEPYIDYLEEELSRVRNVAKYGPVVELAKNQIIERTLNRNETWATLSSRRDTGFSDLTKAPSSPAKSGRVFGLFPSNSGLDSQLKQPSAAVSANPTGTDRQSQDWDLDEMFSFDKLQSLHQLGGRIQEAINILAQNKKLLEQVKKYFQSLVNSQSFLSFVDLQAHAEDTAVFFRGIDKIIGELDGHQARLVNMLHDLEKNTALFNDILQYRNMRLGEFFSTQGQMLAMHANDMSLKSRREGVSMHVITIWTLIFLPGTFVATFFSSGILKFDEVLKFGEWGTSWVGLELFFLIACPIMLMTLAGWGYFYYQARGSKSLEGHPESTNIEKKLEAGFGISVEKSGASSPLGAGKPLSEWLEILQLPAHTAQKQATVFDFSAFDGDLGHQDSPRHIQAAAMTQMPCRVASTLAMTDSPTTEHASHGPAVAPPSIHGCLSNSNPTDEFIAFVKSKKEEYIGRDGHGEERNYVPHTELLTYWTIARIRDACESYSEAISTRTRLIRDRYLGVFSTLVIIGKLSFLPAFQQNVLSDHKFPDTTLPGPWEQSPLHRSMFDDFKRHQWIFFPAILERDSLDDTWLPPERILPISTQAKIRDQLYSDRAAITKVQFHPSCNSLVKSDDSSAENPSYILKTYHGQQHEQHYRHEVQAFARLLHNPKSTEHVVKCHATFKHGETYNLVLEWVAGGDLLQYFQRDRPPRTAEDITDFWDSLSKLNIGLDRIHQIVLRGERSDQYQLVHQDIKPDNILLDIRPGSRPYQFSPIIADLGHSHIRHIKADSPDIPAADHRGNQMYCAPESSHHAGFRRTGPNGITWQADIFSAGAVLSDAASWVAKGEDGRKQYSNRRREQLENTKGFAMSGYETAFHDGFERLPSVDAMHCDIRSTVPSHDRMTPRVLDIIENHMLVLPKDRSRAKLLYGKFEKEVQNARTEALGEKEGLHQTPPPRSLDLSKFRDALPELQTPPPSGKPDRIFSPPGSAPLSISTDGYTYSPETFSPVRSPSTPTQLALLSASPLLSAVASPPPNNPNGQPRRPFPTPNQPASVRHVSQVPEDVLRTITEAGSILSMQDAADWRKAMKLEGQVNSKVKRVIDELIENLKGRDVLFLVDDTESMQEHSMQIEVSFQTLAYIAKSIDPNDLELSFVSKPSEIIKSRRTTLLREEVRHHLSKHTSVKGRIESSLSTLINEKIMKRLPLSVPLFGQVPAWYKPITIFVFTDGKWGEGVPVGNGLTAPISALMREMKKRRLNRTHVMFQFLRFGNDEKGREHLDYLDNFGEEEDWDIVDTRDISGDVHSMFLGPFTHDNDRNNKGPPTARATLDI